jgi:hypothetical protein
MIDKIFDENFISKAIYGSITILAVLFAMDSHPPTAWQGALTLFGTALAVTLAEAYSATIAATISGQKELNRAEAGAIWHHSRPILVVANLPTLVFVLTAVGLYSIETALLVAKGFVFLTLFLYGLRIGHLLHGSRIRILWNGLFAVGIGGLIGVIKVVFHSVMSIHRLCADEDIGGA